MSFPSPEVHSASGSLPLIAMLCFGDAGAFACTAGRLSSDRPTPNRLVDAIAPLTGAALGHLRNHAKGICFTGVFRSNGNSTAVSRAQAFEPGPLDILGRFNLGTPKPDAADASIRARGWGLQISTGGEVWRAAMINAPVFPVSTPEAFHELVRILASREPNAMVTFVAGHPDFAAFGTWAQSPDWTTSYAQEPDNGLHAFIFVSVTGSEQAVRWSFRPEVRAERITPEDFGKRGADYLEQQTREQVAAAPQRWTPVLTHAGPSDQTVDPILAWPEGRRSVETGTVIVQRIEAEADGPCHDISFDQVISPDGIRVPDDPFPFARSAAYAKSYDLHTPEAKDHPYRTTEARR